MGAQQFELVTEWRFDAPRDRVWALLQAVEAWPDWWPAVKRVELIRPGDGQGLGAIRRLTWRTALPYSLSFEIETVRVDPLVQIDGRAFGELDGFGRWSLCEDGGVTRVRYDWRVEVTKPWMRLLAPVLRPAFAWNHGVVMEQGRVGLLRRLA
jgi:uncharacterized protein YndB with AHSA1/START domain